MVERDPIGFDPVKWVDRLLDVNAGSAFTDAQKLVVRVNLRKLRHELDVLHLKGDKP